MQDYIRICKYSNTYYVRICKYSNMYYIPIYTDIFKLRHEFYEE